MSGERLARRIRHPLASARRLARRIVEGHGVPVGRTADTRRLLRLVLNGADRVLVVGPVAAVRQALPATRLDVVGTNPYRPDVTVVSTASDAGSLPRRWDCVVLTDPDRSSGRLAAAAGAGLTGGVLAVVGKPSDRHLDLPGVQVERTLRRGSVQVVLARVVE
jgi:hypothetical protein